MFDPNDIFGQLRSLVHAHDATIAWRKRVSTLLLNSFMFNTNQHLEHVVPYLSSFPNLWLAPLTYLQSTSQLKHWHLLAPFARFELELSEFEWPWPYDPVDSTKALEICQTPGFDQVYRLEIKNISFEINGLQTLLNHLDTNTLRGLELAGEIGNQGAKLIAQSPQLHGLEALELYGGKMNTTGIASIVQSPHLTSLKVLGLAGKVLTNQSVNTLCKSHILPKLHELKLKFWEAQRRAFTKLASSPSLRNLETLHLQCPDIDNSTAQALAHSPHLGNLHTLTIVSDFIDRDGAAILAQSSRLSPQVRDHWLVKSTQN